MIRLTFTIAGDVVLSEGLSRFADACTDYSPVWPDISDDFTRISEEQFDSQGARGGSQWTELSESYGKWKAKHFPGLPLLELSGQLRRSMTSELQIDAQPMKLWMGPLLPRATWHQQGIPANNLPSRPVVSLNETDILSWVRMIQAYLVDKATEEGLR